ncbi:amidohydrolase [Sphingomonas sp. SFZ2018-12]|uniref:amidohydrolase n=1 Tax=Sphingomonas sp. SFZ2018-12 TaxID=2683197 RepID=UPI001F117318|nr:amidohydrolase [Sphingomonas sp. SFZ2018-12]MCH4893166.1 amidohydrolase [Sphingomonas sp. SFZ2018-12]
MRTALALLPLLIAAPAQADAVADATRAQMPRLTALYRDLHAHPELAGQEVRTAALLAAEARKAGFAVTEKVGGTGVVAVLRNGAGPVVLIRTDMDGLPVVEQTGLPFASKVRVAADGGGETGVMHACGHDTHMTAWVATLHNLAAMKDRWSGTLVMIAQPAEERGEGAQAMLDGGLYTRFPHPTHAIAFHDSAGMPAGTIGIKSGYIYANVDTVDVHVRGVGGHGAAPNTTRDPIVLAARIVGTLQTLVARELDPQDPGVVTVGSFHGGATHNIIPDEARLQLTVRSYSETARKTLLEGIARIAAGEAAAAGIPADRMPVVTVKPGYTPATFNTEPLTARMRALLTERFGEQRVRDVPASMVGEDFGRYYLADRSIQSLIVWVGGVPADRWAAAQSGGAALPSLHSPFWAPDPEATFGTAAEALTAAALDILKR